MDREIESFLTSVLETTDFSVALIPHVDPLDGAKENSDWQYMDAILRRLERFGERILLVPRYLNAAQLKHLIGQCRFFMGARTHSTIAAWSQGVPTISIAYSTKANGLNKDLFGHLRYVLETPRVDQHTLAAGLRTLQSEEEAIKQLLGEKLPEWRVRAARTADLLCRVIGYKHPVAA
jgi:polysaccharide pyruvyl transferase WcaK-like protein